MYNMWHMQTESQSASSLHAQTMLCNTLKLDQHPVVHVYSVVGNGNATHTGQVSSAGTTTATPDRPTCTHQARPPPRPQWTPCIHQTARQVQKLSATEPTRCQGYTQYTPLPVPVDTPAAMETHVHTHHCLATSRACGGTWLEEEKPPPQENAGVVC